MFTFHPYGFLIVLGIIAGLLVCYQEIKSRKLNPDIFFDLSFWVLVGGVVGARIYHVIHAWTYYTQNPINFLKVWEGGLGIYGAIIGGALMAVLYSRIKKINLFWSWLDIAALGLPLGQAIGRWGNFFNRELYGYPTDLPWGIYIDPAHRFAPFQNYSRFHPLFLYESLWSLIIFLILLYFSRKRVRQLRQGDLFCLYLIFYSAGRFFIEFLKPDAWYIFGLATAQWIGIVAIIACFVRWKLNKGRTAI